MGAPRRDPNRINFKSWQEVKQHKIGKELCAAYRSFKRDRNKGDLAMAQRTCALLQVTDAPFTRDSLQPLLDAEESEVEHFMVLAGLWHQIPDEELWTFVGYKGIDALTKLSRKGDYDAVVKDIKTRGRAVRTTSGFVSLTFVQNLVEHKAQRFVTADNNTAPMPDKPPTKTGTMVTFEQLLAVAREMQGVFATYPDLMGHFTPATIRAVNNTPAYPGDHRRRQH